MEPNTTHNLTEKERQATAVLIVEPDEGTLAALRSSLLGLNIGTVSAVSDANSANKKLNERKFTHIFVSTSLPDIEVDHFLPTVVEENEGLIGIVVADQPDLELVFELLTHGAKGFIVKPFTEETLDYALGVATKSSPISPAILKSNDRNKTLVELVMNNVDRVADTLRKKGNSDKAQQEISQLMASLANSVEVAVSFAKGGEDAYLEKLEEQLIERSKGAATKLGRLRKKLRSKRRHPK